jgi:single-strand DNA-binding protein
MNQIKNSVFLIGNLGRDPETRTFGDNKSVTRFTMATNEVYRNQQGERVTRTEWHNCTAWGKLGASMQRLLAKGCQVAVQGKLTYNEYTDQAGVKQRRPEIVVEDFYLIDSRQSAAAQSEAQMAVQAAAQPAARRA